MPTENFNENQKLVVLHLEDNPRDHEIIREKLEAEGIEAEFHVVKRREEFESALRQRRFDLIISDFALPTYDGLAALTAAQANRPETPFIFVSGTIGEERAVETLKHGAVDYVVKSNLRRLSAAVRRAVSEAKERAHRKRAEETCQRLAKQMQSILDSAGEGIYGIDPEGRCVFINKAGAEMIGYAAEEVLGRDMHEILHHHRSDGSLYPVEQCPIYRAFKTGERCRVSTEVFWRKDGSSFPVEYASSPILESSAINGAVITFTDITERKQLEAQLLRSQRLESIGTLAGGIAHDLNNVLAPILMSIEILRMKYPAEDTERILTTIESSAQRGADMVKQVLAFARGVQGERVPIQIRHLVKEVGKILKETFPKSIRIRTSLPGDLWSVVADATQLHQVLMNLSVNARDAMPHGGTLTLGAENFLADDTFACMHREAKAGPYLILSIADTGTGIAADVLARMFEPFFTTKPPDKGTGLGLATVRGIVKSHRGFVTVQSELGRGTEFKVHLPAEIESAAEALGIDQRALPMGNGEVVLVVDDEAAIRNIAKQTLEMFGYQVLTAGDGVEAIAVFAQHRAKIKVMLTDMMMPIMDGAATIRAVRSLEPQMKIVAASGLDTDTKAASPDEFGVDAFLTKPYTAERLVNTIWTMIQP